MTLRCPISSRWSARGCGLFQLGLLGLQLFVKLLGLPEHLLQALAIARGLLRSADTQGDGLEKFALTGFKHTHESQFDHAIDAILGLQR